MDVQPDWYDGFFEGDWLDEIARNADAEWSERQTNFLVDKLELETGQRGAGLEVTGSWGNFEGDELELSSRRLILGAEKSA